MAPASYLPATETALAAAHFRVTADACPQVLSRLLGYIAQQDRLIDRLRASRRRERMYIRFSVSDIDAHRAEILTAKMRNLVAVSKVELDMRSSGEGT